MSLGFQWLDVKVDLKKKIIFLLKYYLPYTKNQILNSVMVVLVFLFFYLLSIYF